MTDVIQPPVDIPIPATLVGRPPEDRRGEMAVNAWGPFRVWMEDLDEIVYVGSRARFDWDRISGTLQFRFFPAEPPTMKIYTVLEAGRGSHQVGWAGITDDGVLQFHTAEHGWCELQPILDPAEIEQARRACHLA